METWRCFTLRSTLDTKIRAGVVVLMTVQAQIVNIFRFHVDSISGFHGFYISSETAPYKAISCYVVQPSHANGLISFPIGPRPGQDPRNLRESKSKVISSGLVRALPELLCAAS